MVLGLVMGGCGTEPEALSVPSSRPTTPEVTPSGRNLVGRVNRASDTELVLDVSGGPPPLVFIVRPKDRPNIDVPTLAALAGRRDRVRVFYESIGDKDYALRAERA